MTKSTPSFRHEDTAFAKGFTRVAGLDEVGRGPLAGPVVAAAVVLDPNNIPDGLNDSKQVTAKRRKVWRDRFMVSLAQQHPGYGWDTNMGYPTKEHKAGLKSHGVTLHHRRTFAPVHNILWQEKN